MLLAVDLDSGAEHGANLIATKCISAVIKAMRVQDVDCRIGISIGVALCCSGCTAERILAEADKAMFEAKQRGNGSDQMTPSCEERMMADAQPTNF